jgi:hypothetical protein
MRRVSLIVFIVLLAAASRPQASAVRVLGAEIHPLYLLYSRDASQLGGPWGTGGGLSLGYLISERKKSSTVLSIVAGFDYYTGLKHEHSAFVYGFEYAHYLDFTPTSSLKLAYGLLFNQLRVSGLQGTSYGHHTRLTAGYSFKTGPSGRIETEISWNMHMHPYFDSAKTSYSTLQAGLGYRYYFNRS